MRKRTFAISATLLVLLAVSALAADITGNWTGSTTMGDQAFTLKFTFKQDGEKLTGTVTGPQGDPISISDGKVAGNKLSFVVTVGDQMKITHEGTIKGEEITLTTKMEGGQDFGGGPMTLKRDK